MKRIALSLLLFGILFPVVAAAQSATWTDPATKLMWAGQDNKKDIDWNQAKNYCSNLALAGYSGWRLPTIEELAAIYDPTQDTVLAIRRISGHDLSGHYHIKGGIVLTVPWVWSGSTSVNSAQVMFFHFEDAKTGSNPPHWNYGRRALCVRRP